MVAGKKVSFIGIAKKHGITPNKKLGQHFLINEGVLESISRYCCSNNRDTVIEIGSGIGNLTWFLSGKAKKVYALERDEKLIEVLKDTLSDCTNVEIVKADALNFDVSTLKEKPAKLCGNLPYNIATGLIINYLLKYSFIKEYVVMIQKEVAQRICAKPGDFNYGALTVKIFALADVEVLMEVKPGSFWPPPEVESTVIKVKRNVKMSNFLKFKQLLEAAFSHRRKTVLNSLFLSGYRDFSKQEWSKILKESQIKPALRPQNISFKSYKELFKFMNSQSSEN